MGRVAVLNAVPLFTQNYVLCVSRRHQVTGKMHENIDVDWRSPDSLVGWEWESSFLSHTVCDKM